MAHHLDPFGLGFPIKSLSEEEIAATPEGGAIYLMIRVEDDDPNLAWPALRRRRFKTLCDRCQAPCWLDPLSARAVPAHIERICNQCLEAEHE